MKAQMNVSAERLLIYIIQTDLLQYTRLVLKSCVTDGRNSHYRVVIL